MTSAEEYGVDTLAVFSEGANVIVLDPDVAKVFTDSESVNKALRALAGIIQHQSEKVHP
jgi:hypothetical protein